MYCLLTSSLTRREVLDSSLTSLFLFLVLVTPVETPAVYAAVDRRCLDRLLGYNYWRADGVSRVRA